MNAMQPIAEGSADSDELDLALMLSGGGVLGNYHIGVVRVLHEAGLLPRLISGSSAGSLIGALIGTRSDAELASDLAEDIPAIAAPSPDDPEFYRLAISAEMLREFVAKLVPDITFAEALEESGRHLAVSVAGEGPGGDGLLLSARTTPHVLLHDALMASCAVPYVYPPVALRERHRGRDRDFMPGLRWIDGSVHADLPKAELARQYGARRFAASIANPLTLPFITTPEEHGVFANLMIGSAVRGSQSAIALWCNAMRPWTAPFPGIGNVIDLWGRVAAQDYGADLLIAPRQRLHDPRGLLSFGSEDQRLVYIREGEAAMMEKLDLFRALVNA